MIGDVRSMSEDSEGASYSRCRPVSTCCSFDTARDHFFPEAQTRRKQVDPLLTLRSPAPYKDPSLFLNRFRFSRRPPCCPLLACSGCLADSFRYVHTAAKTPTAVEILWGGMEAVLVKTRQSVWSREHHLQITASTVVQRTVARACFRVDDFTPEPTGAGVAPQQPKRTGQRTDQPPT